MDKVQGMERVQDLGGYRRGHRALHTGNRSTSAGTCTLRGTGAPPNTTMQNNLSSKTAATTWRIMDGHARELSPRKVLAELTGSMCSYLQPTWRGEGRGPWNASWPKQNKHHCYLDIALPRMDPQLPEGRQRQSWKLIPCSLCTTAMSWD